MIVTCIIILAALLVIGAMMDIRSRRLPNWLTAGVAVLYVVYAAISPTPVDWFSSFSVAGASFVVGFALFTFNLMGGGDVKLISSLALWAGVDFIALFLLVTGIAGGLMSIAYLLFRHLANHPLLVTVWPFLSVMMADRLGFALPMRFLPGGPNTSQADPATVSLPYGVAIAAGGFVVIYALLKL